MKCLVPVRSFEDFKRLKEGDLVGNTEGSSLVCGSWKSGERLYENYKDKIFGYQFNNLFTNNDGRVTPQRDDTCLVSLNSQEYLWARHLFKKAEEKR